MLLNFEALNWNREILSVVDDGIRPVVEILNNHGFKTFELCEGGKGHCYSDPTVRFYGSEIDLIRAFEICLCYKLNVFEVKRVYRKEDIYKLNESKNAGVCAKPASLVFRKSDGRKSMPLNKRLQLQSTYLCRSGVLHLQFEYSPNWGDLTWLKGA